MTRYYVAKEFEKRKKLLNDILGGENYQIFDDSNEEEVMHVLKADFDLVILFDHDQTRQHDEFLDYIKSMQKKGIIAIISPYQKKGTSKVDGADNIYLFKDLNNAKQSQEFKKKLARLTGDRLENQEEKKEHKLAEPETTQPSTTEEMNNKEENTTVPKIKKTISVKPVKNTASESIQSLPPEITKVEDKVEPKSFYYKISRLENIAIENSYIFIHDYETMADEGNHSNPINMENGYPPHIDRKSLSARYKLTNRALSSINKKRKKIAVWKPYENRTALHIIMNFAIYLAESGLNVAVIESLSREGELLERLSCYTEPPSGWCNFMETVFNPHKPIDKDKIIWRWNNVDWYPLTPAMNTNGVEWYPKDLDFYMSVLDNYDISFIYIPQATGIPIRPSDIEILFAMRYANELWVFADNFFKITENKKEYIHELQNSYFNIDRSYLVYTNCLDMKTAYNAERALEVPLLATFPFFEHEIYMNNHHGSELLMKNENVSSILLNEFKKMREHYPEYRWIWEKIEVANNIIPSDNWVKKGERFLRLKSLFR